MFGLFKKKDTTNPAQTVEPAVVAQDISVAPVVDQPEAVSVPVEPVVADAAPAPVSYAVPSSPSFESSSEAAAAAVLNEAASNPPVAEAVETPVEVSVTEPVAEVSPDATLVEPLAPVSETPTTEPENTGQGL